jgi:hypothetical protein
MGLVPPCFIFKMGRKRSILGSLEGMGRGLSRLSLSTAVGAGIAARAPAGTPSLTGGFRTLAGFTPIAVTATAGRSVLKSLKRKKSKKFLSY